MHTLPYNMLMRTIKIETEEKKKNELATAAASKTKRPKDPDVLAMPESWMVANGIRRVSTKAEQVMRQYLSHASRVFGYKPNEPRYILFLRHGLGMDRMEYYVNEHIYNMLDL